MSGASSQSKKYAAPDGVLGLKGPVAKPEPGTLPLRGDLAHIALAGKHLAAHYVIPHVQIVVGSAQHLTLAPSDDSDTVLELSAGEAIEVLDVAGNWAWATKGPSGPSGYVRISALGQPT
ncbi:MAG: hypothetical protein AAGK17_03575 [Pseudomonadota bacterium]